METYSELTIRWKQTAIDLLKQCKMEKDPAMQRILSARAMVYVECCTDLRQTMERQEDGIPVGTQKEERYAVGEQSKSGYDGDTSSTGVVCEAGVGDPTCR